MSNAVLHTLRLTGTHTRFTQYALTRCAQATSWARVVQARLPMRLQGTLRCAHLSWVVRELTLGRGRC